MSSAQANGQISIWSHREQLLPEMGDPTARQAWVEGALYGCAVLHRIRWEGRRIPLTLQVSACSYEYGECAPGTPALITLLEFVQRQVGSIDRHRSHS